MSAVKWIPVKERLPEASGEYLVFNAYSDYAQRGYLYVIDYSSKHRAFNAFDTQDEELVQKHAFTNVAFWAELPEPPEGWVRA